MRVIFMGTPEFAVPSLRWLAGEHDVVAVYVRPDAVSGRGKSARPAPVKLAAAELGLCVRQPGSLRDSEAVAELSALAADVICVAAYGLILPPAVLEAAPLGAVNVHASLLPRWRGAAPIQRAILAGDRQVGVSIMRMEEGLDTGPYCLQEAISVAEKSAAQLTAELGELGARMLVSALPSIADGTARWVEQDEALVTYASKVSKDETAPSPALSAHENLLRIQASLATAPARILIDGKGVTVLQAIEDSSTSGLLSGAVRGVEGGIALGTTDGGLVAVLIKPDGKAEMPAAAWARGARLTDESVWASVR